MTEQSILEEADHIVHNSRRESYGDPAEHWEHVASVWTARLGKKLTAPLTAIDAQILMIDLKLCREQHAHKRDNLVDVAGYAYLIEETDEKQGER